MATATSFRTLIGAALGVAVCGLGCSNRKPEVVSEAAAAPLTELTIHRVNVPLGAPDPGAAFWKDVPPGTVALTAQPMLTPRPETTTTESITVQAAHDGKTVAFRLTWKDTEKSEAGRLAQYSDALALEFPVGDGAATPVMMGAKDHPVHIFHWRAQYQRDKELGKPTISDLYPNVAVDMYAMDFKDAPGGTASEKESFSPGRAVGNPQAYEKTGVDEVIAEGFSTSAVQEGHSGAGQGVWADGRWSLVITRPLAVDGGSALQVGGSGFVAFAVWQGGKGEVGSRKCVTMTWVPLKVAP